MTKNKKERAMDAITAHHDANLNAMFAALRTQIIRSLELVTPGNGRWDYELYRESLADELRIEAEIIEYVADDLIGRILDSETRPCKHHKYTINSSGKDMKWVF